MKTYKDHICNSNFSGKANHVRGWKNLENNKLKKALNTFRVEVCISLKGWHVQLYNECKFFFT